MRNILKKPFAIMITASLLLCGCTAAPSKREEKKDGIVYEAVYPVMAKMPLEEDYYGEKTDPEGYAKALDAWEASVNTQKEMAPAHDEGMNTYLVKSIREYLGKNHDNNLVYSPLNLYFALAILAELTDGQSRKEVLDLLGVKDIESLRTYVRSLWNGNYLDDEISKLVLGSSLWIRNDMSYKPEVFEVLRDNYYASVFGGTMGDATFDLKLQTWINEQTNSLLKDSAGNLKLDPETIIALVTTIYLKAKWIKEFDEAANIKREFENADGSITENVEYMQGYETGEYAWGKHFTAYRKPLDNGYGSHMYFIMPEKGMAPDLLVNDEECMDYILCDYRNRDWQQKASATVNLMIPKFDVSSEIDLAEGMRALGVVSAFEENADFTPLSDEKTYLNECKHAARVKIDEDGVEAAAYTIMIAMGTAFSPNEPVEFLLDRAFVFVITGSNGLPVFVGTVNSLK